MAEQGVAVKADLGVEHAQTAIFHDDQRVDLEHRHVLLDEGLVEDREEFHAIFAGRTVQLQRVAELRRIGFGHTSRRVDWQGEDFLRRLVRNFLDVHAAFSRGNKGRTARGAVNEKGEIEFAVNVGAVFNVEAVDLFASIAGLRGDEVIAQHRLGVIQNVFLGEGEANTALFASCGFDELALAASTGMNLGLHDPERPRQRIDRLLHIIERKNGYAFCHWSAERFQHGLGLVFVYVHGNLPCLPWLAERAGTGRPV